MAGNKDEMSRSEVHRFFLQGLVETVGKMAGIELMENKADLHKKFKLHISGTMILSGSKNALLVISTERDSAANLVAYMTGIDINDLKDNELFDGISEIVNMVSGIAKSRLADTDCSFKLSSPFAFVGEDIKLVTKNCIEKYEYVTCSEGVTLLLGIYYF